MTNPSSILKGIVISLGLAVAAPCAPLADETPSAVVNAEPKPSDPNSVASPDSSTPFAVVGATKSSSEAAEEPQMTENADKRKKVDKTAITEAEHWHRDGFALKKGTSRIELSGYVQEDFRRFDWGVRGDETGAELRPTRELRRARIGAQAVFGRLSFEIGLDPRDAGTGSHLKDSTVGYQFSKQLSLLAGHFKPPISQEFLTSASKADFVERSLVSVLSPDRDWGAAISGELGRVEYAIGGFAGDGDGAAQRSKVAGAARISVRLVRGLRLAGSFMQGKVTPDQRVGSEEPAPKGASGKALSGFTFWNRAHVSGTRERIGTDLQFARGPFRVRGELLQEQEQRKGQGSTGQNIPDIRGRGWAFAASYVLTGEKKGSTVEPSKPVFRGGKGALEVAARVEGLKFDDTGDPSGFAGYGNRARNIAPSGTTALEAGLNYWASNFLKFQGSALWESYNDPLIAPAPGKTGRYFTLVARVQVMIP